jgi:hypothetical protein
VGRITSYRQSDERYLTLRIVGLVCTVIGAVLLVVGTVLLVVAVHVLVAGMTSEPPRVVNPFAVHAASVVPFAYSLGGALTALWSLGFLFSGLQFLAIGTLIRLAIHVEENTRMSAQCLEKIRVRLEPRDENVTPLFPS